MAKTLIIPSRNKLIGGRARSFIPGGGWEYLYTNSSPISDVPCTFSFHGWVDASAGAVAVMSACKSGSDTRYLVVLFQNNKLRIGQHETYIDSSNTWPDETWVHGAVTFVSDTERHIYLNNTKTDNTDTTTAFSGLDRFGVGVLYDNTPSSPFWGRIANVAVWNAVLSDDEIAALYNNGIGLDPQLIRPDALVSYWPLTYNDRNYAITGSQYDLTQLNNPTWAPGPLIQSRTKPSYFTIGAVVPSDEMAGTGTSTSTGAGTLTASYQIAGTGLSNSTGVGTLAGGITPSEISGNGTSTSSGVATLAFEIAGTGTSTSTGNAQLFDGTGPSILNGSGLSTSSGFGTFEKFNQIAGTGTSTSNGWADILAVVPLAGDGASLSSGIEVLLKPPSQLAGLGTSYSTGFAHLVNGVISVTAPGMEYSLRINRLHYTLALEQPHYTLFED